MIEIFILAAFLAVGFILAPLMANAFFLNHSKAYFIGHMASFALLLLGDLLGLHLMAAVWPLFCAWGFFLYLKKCDSCFTLAWGAGCIPFLFSLISSVWFVAGVNDLHLLGFGRTWSFYAALHGLFLGWIFVGCVAFLAKKKSKPLYLWATYLSLVLFLCVAYGINGVPHIKRVGVIGFSLLAPFLIAHFAFHLAKDQKISRILSGLSLLSIFASMALALLNEFWMDFPRAIVGIPTMVFTHGLINALVAVPCFFLAVKLDRELGLPTLPPA